MLHISPAYLAALALIAIQVGIGVLYKTVQTHGQYEFSVSSSITISEFLKLALSTILFYRECHYRSRSTYQQVDAHDDDSDSDSDSPREDLEKSPAHELRPQRQGLISFVQTFNKEVPPSTKIGFAHLALLYALINNTVFLVYRLADPGTFQLVKSSGTVITALIMLATIGTKISGKQWIAIGLQICGLIISQHRPGSGAIYPLSTYSILLFQTFVSSVSGVYNQVLSKSADASLHADNMMLYGFGTFFNAATYIVISRLVNIEEPGFFDGYNTWGAYLVILSNVFIGLAMTAVYKYADAIIKCFATAVATAFLLYLSFILFHVPLSLLVIPGSGAIMFSTWLYLTNPPSNSASQPASEPQPSEFVIVRILQRLTRNLMLRLVALVFFFLATLTCIGLLTKWDIDSQFELGGPDHPPPLSKTFPKYNSTITPSDKQTLVIESPFKNTVGLVRFNSPRKRRLPLIKKYTPFFHTLHISFGPHSSNMVFDAPPVDEPYKLTMDGDTWGDSNYPYHLVAHTMQMILDSHDAKTAKIDGLLFFHFDAWIDPLGFKGMDLEKMWLPKGMPWFRCVSTREEYGPWNWDRNLDRNAIKAMQALKADKAGYVVDKDQFCVGWSDIYYVPRRYFTDYIYLSHFFYNHSAPVFHEIAIPTILHTIDLTYRKTPFDPVMTHVGDCWGDCCRAGVKPIDILEKRCGHKIDYRDMKTAKVHFDRLDKETTLLGTMAEVKDPIWGSG